MPSFLLGQKNSGQTYDLLQGLKYSNPMIRRIPPLNPLRVFEVVARTKNFTLAAKELYVTQSAVSRQVGALETYLGQELVRRLRHGIELTIAGQSYANQLSPAFQQIAKATEDLIKTNDDNTLRIRTYTTFAAKWLIPRLGEFQEKHSHIEVKISNGISFVDFDRDKVDIAIQLGSGQWPNARSMFLFEDEIEPVCSPGFMRRNAPSSKFPTSLLRLKLLTSHYRRTDWATWLNATELTNEAIDSLEMSFSTSLLTWQAAVDGLGIAIGQSQMLTHEFESQLLVRPFNHPVRSGLAYYLVWPKHSRASRKVSAFKDWLTRTLRL